MATRVAEAEVHTSVLSDAISNETTHDLPVSVDRIDDRLYLGNLPAACDPRTLARLGVTHVLTVDAVPLPRAMLDSSATAHSLTLKYIKMADVEKEDLITHLPETNDFIQRALDSGGTILVHCYFGVSRSAAVVIAYVMSKRGLCYQDAFKLVKSQRPFIGPNAGFVAQLKLFGHMGCKLDKEDPRFKQFRLKMAGQKLKEVKILPQLFAELVRPDPGLVRERPEPCVYRCRKCRRIVAEQRNIIPHAPKQVKQSADVAHGGAAETERLAERLSSLGVEAEAEAKEGANEHHEYEGGLVDPSIVASDARETCRLVHFVEPMAWMRDVQHATQGKLYCPKCANKIGSFNWVMGCKCPCGKKVAPAFYLVPSKVEWSNIVQNVQITV